MSPEYFLRNYVWIQDRTLKKTIKWEPWPYLIDLIRVFIEHREVIILKARQLGISWLVVAFCVWDCLFNENVKNLLLSQGEKEAADLVGGGEKAVPGKAKFIYNHLPDWLRPRIGRDTQSLIDFPDTGGIIEALPSTEKAGRSTDATRIIRDELARHPYADENFAAVGPTVDAGGHSIDLSTADKTKLTYHFKSRYVQATLKENSAHPIFLSRDLRPGRDRAWLEEMRKKYPAWQVEQEYPLTEDEALGTLEAIAFFDAEATDAMLADVMQPVHCDELAKYKTVRVYKLPVVGNKYCLFTDPSDGKEDPHASIVMDWATGEEMAESHGKVPADQCAEIHDALARFYNNAFNDFERNANPGGKFGETIKNLETPNRHYQDKKKEGWWTGEPQRKVMVWGLEEAIRHLSIRPHSRECINEFKQFIQPAGEKPQALADGHDDYIMAWAGVWQIRKAMPVGMARASSFKYREGEGGIDLWRSRFNR